MFNCISKAYSLPGWRVAALLGDASVIARVANLKSQADYGLFLPLQHAASAVLLSGGRVPEETALVYRKRCQVLAGGLASMGWRVSAPVTGACVWAGLPDKQGPWGGDLSKAAEVILANAAVCTLPGSEFGEKWGDFIRFACVVSEEKIREVLRRMAGVGNL